MVGHTKFAPDWCFGLVKRRYRRTFVSSLQEIVGVVDSSTQKGINIAQLVGNESGEVFVPVYDWSSHLAGHYHRIHGIKSYQHFYFESKNPGEVKCKRTIDGVQEAVKFARSPPALTLPPVIQPEGLSEDRKTYLYEQIREFCKDETKDVVCPSPDS